MNAIRWLTVNIWLHLQIVKRYLHMKKLLLLSLLLLVLLSAFSQPGWLGAPANGKLPTVLAPAFKKDTISIAKFGAVADGNTLNTKAINNAIDALAKKGGGVVMVPQGLWLTGPVVLKSNINLCLANGALLLFTNDQNWRTYLNIMPSLAQGHRCTQAA